MASSIGTLFFLSLAKYCDFELLGQERSGRPLQLRGAHTSRKTAAGGPVSALGSRAPARLPLPDQGGGAAASCRLDTSTQVVLR